METAVINYDVTASAESQQSWLAAICASWNLCRLLRNCGLWGAAVGVPGAAGAGGVLSLCPGAFHPRRRRLRDCRRHESRCASAMPAPYLFPLAASRALAPVPTTPTVCATSGAAKINVH